MTHSGRSTIWYKAAHKCSGTGKAHGKSGDKLEKKMIHSMVVRQKKVPRTNVIECKSEIKRQQIPLNRSS